MAAGANAIAMDCTFCESNIREDVSTTIRRIHEQIWGEASAAVVSKCQLMASSPSTFTT